MINTNMVIKGIFIIARQDLHRTEVFSTAMLAGWLGICGKLRGDAARRGDSNRPKRYFRPYTQYIKWGNICSDDVCLLKSPLHVMGSCSPGGGRTLG